MADPRGAASSAPAALTATAEAAAERQRVILERVRHAGSVSVEDLAAAMRVTPQTIRKDLNQLAQRSLVARVHGGAVVTSGVDNIAYPERRLVASDAKRAIGRAAAALVPDGASLFINIGSTTEAVAHHLTTHRDLMVCTNNLNVVDMLAGRPGLEVNAVGGRVRAADRAVVGALAMEFIRNFRVDYALIGASGIEPDGALTDFDVDEVQVSRTIIRNARQVILVADASKLARPAPVRIADMADIDFFVTDRLESDALRTACAAAGTRVIETDGGAGGG